MFTLRNSGPVHPHGSRKLRSKPDKNQIITVTIVLRAASSEDSRKKAIREVASRLPRQKKHLSSEDFIRRQGAFKKDIALIERFAKTNGLRIVETNRTRRCVILSGTVAQFAQVFGVDFALHEHAGTTYRSHQGEIQIPSSLRDAVKAVLGLENRPLMDHHAFAKATATTAHTDPADVCRAYDFPPNANGAKQRIAIVELGGGYYETDLKAFFESLGLKMPQITCLELDGQRNDPASRDEIKQVLDLMGATSAAKNTNMDPAVLSKGLWTIEASLDLQLAGAFANGAEIVVYFAPNNSQGKYHALTTALHSEQHPPTIISCSWGAVEENLSTDFVQSLDQVFQDAALKGVTICFSSGDKGEDPDKNGSPRVHFPASSPNVLSCGGTHWVGTEDQPDEVVWSEQRPAYVAQTGGGVSKLFQEPEWQSSADIQSKTGRTGRGVPDVAGKADMAQGYRMIVGGYIVTMGGTSSAVPMWAGLIARLNQELGKNIGYITPLLYQHASAALTDIIEGKNGNFYKAEPGWDACTGLGSPVGTKLLGLLK